MPCDWTKYPKNWKTEIRPRILKRDGNRCKKCGLQNHSIVIAKTRCPVVEGCTYAWAKDNLGFYHDMKDGKAVIIVLTIAHLDHDTTNNADENLAALCQKCHLTHDAEVYGLAGATNHPAVRCEVKGLCLKHWYDLCAALESLPNVSGEGRRSETSESTNQPL